VYITGTFSSCVRNSGKSVRLFSRKGKIAFIDFRGARCVPCRSSFPALCAQGFVVRRGVDGITTKLPRDREGNIVFRTIGFNGADKMTMQLDMLSAE
jgi:hypothetical protein